MIEILYDTKNYVVCIKPYGIVSQHDEHKPNMVDLLQEQLFCNIFPVHRLDRTSAGVMVFAKNEKTAALLSKQITDGVFKKEYYALIHGELECGGTMEDLLYFDKTKNKSYVVGKERKGVKKAELQYMPISRNGGCTLVKIKLMTGRTHQIRVQFASRKMPLAGDRRYGAKDDKINIALWSYKIEFKDTETNENLIFTAEPNSEFGV